MCSSTVKLPLINLARYNNPNSVEDRERVVEELCSACRQYGFFQVEGHGVPVQAQENLMRSMEKLFELPKEEKLSLSFLQSPCRRGYEASGMSLRDGDALPDSKEAFYIGREDPVIEPPGFYGPNVWPDIPHGEFRDPVWEYYTQAEQLGRTIWEILLEGLGHPPNTLDKFAKRPMVMMKMIRYPAAGATLPNQFGVGPHTDFGGITCLLQQPGREGLEVWHEGQEAWIPVPSRRDVLVINCGDIVKRWSGGVYKSARHRVINRAEAERLSCAIFWHGDAGATNPLSPQEPDFMTVGQLLVQRFRNQFSLQKVHKDLQQKN